MFHLTLRTAAVLLGFLAVASVRADDQDDLRALIAKGLKAAGGKEQLGKFKAGTCKITGKSLENNNNDAFSFTGYLQGMDQVKVEGDVDHGGMQVKVAFIINGDQGWANFGGKVEDAPKDALRGIKDVVRAFYFVHLLVPLTDKAATLSPLGEVNVDGKTTVGLKVASKDREDIHVFLDKATGLPRKAEFKMKRDNGRESTLEFMFSDYKETDGRKHFTKVTAKQDDKAIFEVDLSEFRWLDSLDASVFARP